MHRFMVRLALYDDMFTLTLFLVFNSCLKKSKDRNAVKNLYTGVRNQKLIEMDFREYLTEINNVFHISQKVVE